MTQNLADRFFPRLCRNALLAKTRAAHRKRPNCEKSHCARGRPDLGWIRLQSGFGEIAMDKTTTLNLPTLSAAIGTTAIWLACLIVMAV